MTLIYNGGDMLSVANQAAHAEENRQLKQLGFQVYSPQDDKTINDKTNQTVESNNSLAEKIFDRDTKGMEKADIIIFEVANTNVGTTTEIGQWAMKNQSTALDKFFFFHSYDIRRTSIPEIGDRRSWSINQYLYGAILSLNPNGIENWNTIINKLIQLRHAQDMEDQIKKIRSEI